MAYIAPKLSDKSDGGEEMKHVDGGALSMKILVYLIYLETIMKDVLGP